MGKLPKLDDAYALDGEDAIRSLYADWAHSYDAGFGDAMGYQLPRAVALGFVAAGGTGPVLDIGAGTGLVAEHLTQHGVGPLDALDLSQDMLDVAEAKGLYRDLYAADFLSPDHGLPRDTYLGIVSAGTFTHGHVGPEGLEPLVDLLKPGGNAVISVNLAFFEKFGFAAKIAGLESDLVRFETRDVRIYDDRADAQHRNDLARLLRITKA